MFLKIVYVICIMTIYCKCYLSIVCFVAKEKKKQIEEDDDMKELAAWAS